MRWMWARSIGQSKSASDASVSRDSVSRCVSTVLARAARFKRVARGRYQLGFEFGSSAVLVRVRRSLTVAPAPGPRRGPGAGQSRLSCSGSYFSAARKVNGAAGSNLAVTSPARSGWLARCCIPAPARAGRLTRTLALAADASAVARRLRAGSEEGGRRSVRELCGRIWEQGP